MTWLGCVKPQQPREWDTSKQKMLSKTLSKQIVLYADLSGCQRWHNEASLLALLTLSYSWHWCLSYSWHWCLSYSWHCCLSYSWHCCMSVRSPSPQTLTLLQTFKCRASTGIINIYLSLLMGGNLVFTLLSRDPSGKTIYYPYGTLLIRQKMAQSLEDQRRLLDPQIEENRIPSYFLHR